MLSSVNSERYSAGPECLKLTEPYSYRPAILAIVAALCLFSCRAQAQTAPEAAAQSSVQAYADAIKQSVIAQRITAMERYLALSSGGSLKVDALEFLVWDHMR